MGLIDDALSAIDRAKRIGKRSLADAYQNPSDFADMTAYRAAEQLQNPMFPVGMGLGGMTRALKPIVPTPGNPLPLQQAAMSGNLHSLGVIDDAAYGRMMRAPTMDQELLNLIHSEALAKRGMLNQR